MKRIAAGFRRFAHYRLRVDMEALSSPHAVGVFAAFVRSEREFAELLGQRIEDDEAMLTDMTSG